MIPILIRTKNRVNYLHITLKSLFATDLLDSKIIISDDCSDNEDMKKYLFSNDVININPLSWHDQIKNEFSMVGISCRKNDDYNNKLLNLYNNWDTFVGNIPNNDNIRGIKDKCTIIQPTTSMGDNLGLLWTINAGFTLFKNAEYLIILDDDLIFNKNWLKIINFIYLKESNSNLGLISIYNQNDEHNNLLLYNETTSYINRVIHVIPKRVYKLLKNNKYFNIAKHNNIENIFLYNFIKENKLKILNTSLSYIQHIGVNSISSPGKLLRYSRNFIKPYTWDKNFDNRKL